MLKNFFAVLLAFAFAFAFAACGSQGKNKEASTLRVESPGVSVASTQIFPGPDGQNYVIEEGSPIPTRIDESGDVYIDFSKLPALGENYKPDKSASQAKGEPRTSVVYHGDHTHIVEVD